MPVGTTGPALEHVGTFSDVTARARQKKSDAQERRARLKKQTGKPDVRFRLVQKCVCEAR
eukprot:13079931-Alexandrium_andersonii.AAC.1